MNDRELEDALSGIHVARTQLPEPDELYGRVATIPEAGSQRRFRWPRSAPLAWLTSATRLTVVLVFVLIAGAVLIVGQPGDDGTVVAPGGSPSSTASDPLAGYVTEEVEPGIFLVANDGIRDLEGPWPDQGRLLPASDGSVWLLLENESLRLGDRLAHPPLAGIRGVTDVALGPNGALRVLSTVADEQWRGRADEPADIATAAQGADGTVWARFDPMGMNDPIARLDESGWTVLDADDGIPALSTLRPWGPVAIAVDNDGGVWTSPADVEGLVHFDGTTWTSHMEDGTNVLDVAVGPGGAIWIVASHQEDPDARLNIYAIPDGQAVKEDSMQIPALRSARPTAAATAALLLTVAATATPVAAQSETEGMPLMTPFTASMSCSGAMPSGGVAWGFRVEEVSDDRLDGQYISHLKGWEDGDPDDGGIGAYSALLEIRGASGGWLGEYDIFRFEPDSYSTFSVQLDGNGDYEGLSAVLEADFRNDCGWDVRGVVVEGEMPDHPEPLGT